MTALCERMGFSGIIIARNGLEGTLAAFLNRPLKLSCSARTCIDEYTRREFSVDPAETINREIKTDENISSPSLEENVRLIQSYQKTGRSDNECFDLRVKVTCEAVRKAVEWIAPRIEE